MNSNDKTYNMNKQIIELAKSLGYKSPGEDSVFESWTFIYAYHHFNKANTKIGTLVRKKMISGNTVPIERCVITEKEVREIDETPT